MLPRNTEADWVESVSCPDGSTIIVYRPTGKSTTCFKRGGVTQICSTLIDKATAKHIVSVGDYNLHNIKLVLEKIDDGDMEMLKLCALLGD